MEQIWNSILELTARFVTPDWGSLVALLPIAILALVVLFVGWLLWRLSTLGPTRRGKGRVKPVPPAGVHMPGPSLAPIFGAIGTALLLFGLVFGGVMLFLGFAALVLTLLYWGREAMRDYDRATGAENRLPAVVHSAPPAGVHMPGPSFRPFVGALATAALLFGLVFGGWLLAVGFIMLVVSLVGWLRDARAEYNLAERADRTGHLDSLPAPRVPKGTFALFGALFVFAIILNSGLIPPGSASGSTAGSPAPGGSGAPGGSAAPGASAAASVPAADVTVVAKGVQFDTATLSATAGKPWTIAFVNKDPSIQHDIEFRDSAGVPTFTGAAVTGVNTVLYNVPTMSAGTYKFVCTFHPNMVGVLTVK